MSFQSVNEIANDSENTQKRKKTSDVWNHFSSIGKGEDGRGRVMCNYCKRSYLYDDSRNGTSTLSRHMGVCKKKPNESVGDVSLISEQGILGRVIDQKICCDLIAQCTIEHDLPFKWVEYRSMRLLLQYLNPYFQFITRNTAASDVMRMYGRQKERLKLVLKNIIGMLCLTCDVWTACTNAGYICLTVHYVDKKWRLDNKILSFCDMPPPHGRPLR